MKILTFLSQELNTEAPERIQLFAYGKTRYNHGGEEAEYVFCEADADRLIAEFKQNGVDVPIDYHHQSIYAAKTGNTAPASGWIVGLERGADGLYANIKWTDRAKEFISKKEYRYTSPTFYRTETGRVASLYNLALTNKPATLDSPALVAAEKNPPDQQNPGKTGANMKGVLTLLGLSADLDASAAEGAIRNKVEPLISTGQAAEKLIKTLREPLALSNDAGLNEITGAVLGIVDQAKTAKATSEKLVALEAELSEAKVEKLIDDALEERKLTNAQVEWAKTQTPEQLESYLSTASPVVPSPNPKEEKPREKQPEVSGDVEKIRAAFGHKPEDFEPKKEDKE